ncbi:cation:proton antiporter [Pararhizobium sp. PWRC1-1]|uniref:cation:proton antiporter domain-containing protein n=1 Tax=Pararhizobium sp. PWRC1-1 TaxID=2804566 RepID=UPI003CF44229
MTFTAYGVTQLLGSYGFLAVFLAAVAFRQAEREHDFNEQLHDFAEQLERLLMMVLLVCLGAIAASGSLFANIDWKIVTLAVLTLVIVRPVLGWLSLIGTGHALGESVIIAIFGIRGLGSIYCLAYATGQPRRQISSRSRRRSRPRRDSRRSMRCSGCGRSAPAA